MNDRAKPRDRMTTPGEPRHSPPAHGQFSSEPVQASPYIPDADHTGSPLTVGAVHHLQRSVGNRAVQTMLTDRRASSAAPPARSAPSHPPVAVSRDDATRPRVRRLVTQIIPGGDEHTIGKVLIVGRPEKVFSSSMGDHTTAFAAHAESLKLRLEQKRYGEAIQVIDVLATATQQLPGLDLLLNPQEGKSRLDLPDSHRGKLNEAYNHLTTVRATLPSADNAQKDHDPAQVALNLQEYVNAYLSFRELVPLSVINVRAKSAALAGKGKGESGHAAILAAHERGDKQAQPMLQRAVYGLFDTFAAALVSAEQDDKVLREMAPGLSTAIAMEERAVLMINQHLQSIATSFPTAWADAGLDVEAARKSMVARIGRRMVKVLRKERRRYRRDIRKRKYRIPFLKSDEATTQGKVGKRKAKDYRLSVEAEIVDREQRIASIDSLLKQYKENAASQRAAEIREMEFGGSDSTEMEVNEVEEEDKEDDGKDEEGKDVGEEDEEVDEEAEADEREEEQLAKEERKQSLANQILLDQAGNIKEVRSAGRSPSPFPGTMGAHTTSWVDGGLSGKKGKQHALRV